ncbi:MAG: fumarate reductase subunit D [Armatimonadota bacterium]|nr:fumarate reductase subunit D [Armatimonadota bacterium]MDR5696998.1 fumarate reductase subunit D [Armatimonadota bacterium]
MRSEPLWWLLFAAGGTVAALLLPVHVLLTGVGVAAGWTRDALAYERAVELVAHPVGRAYVFAVVASWMLHWAHRFRYTLTEGLHLKASWVPVAFACYGTAVGIVAAAAVVLARL